MDYQDVINKMTLTPNMGKIAPFSHYVTGEATFGALKQTVDELTHTVPKDHDIVILGYNLIITEVRYIGPHTFIFGGHDDKGNKSFVICHYSQLLVKVVNFPKQEEERVIVGFRPNPEGV